MGNGKYKNLSPSKKRIKKAEEENTALEMMRTGCADVNIIRNQTGLGKTKIKELKQLFASDPTATVSSEDVKPGKCRIFPHAFELELIDIALRRERNCYAMTDVEFRQFVVAYAVFSGQAFPKEWQQSGCSSKAWLRTYKFWRGNYA